MRVGLRALAVAVAAVTASVALSTAGAAPAGATERTAGTAGVQVVHRYFGPMPTGVTVSRHGRIFSNFPRWIDQVPATVTEIRGGREVPYPNAAINQLDTAHAATHFISVQSVVVDQADRLWALDTGRINFGPMIPGGAKLVGIDLRTNQVVRSIPFPPDVALSTTELNDVRFDLRRGRAGMAFITDSSANGPNAIIVVDLATGQSWRRLNDHPTVKAEPNFTPIIEGQPWLVRPPDAPPSSLTEGVDGIAISPDGRTLFYCALSSRTLYSVSVDALADRGTPDSAVAATVRNLGRKGMSDGLETDRRDRVYGGDIERNALIRRLPDGRIQTVVQGSRIIWIDTLSMGADGFMYFTVNQLNRLPRFHEDKDLRVKPYVLYRVRIDH